MVANLYAFSGGGGGGGTSLPDAVPYPGQVTAVPRDAETTVVSHVVPAGYTFRLLGVIVTGSSDAEWIVYDNSTVVYRDRTSGAERGKEILHGNAIAIASGHTVSVKAVHEEINVQNFYATLLGFE